MKINRFMLVASLALALSSCSDDRIVSGYRLQGLHTIEHDGHTYIRDWSSHGVALLHDPDCKCDNINKKKIR